MGEGWDAATCLSWFDKRIKTRSDDDTAAAKITQETVSKKCSPYQPASMGRNIQTPYEMEESLIILKSLSTVCLVYDNDVGRGYSMTCDVTDATDQDPSLLTGDHKKFYNDPTFECGNNMIISLPFSFVEKLRVGKDKPLPPNWLRQVKSDALNSHLAQIKSMQLWRYRRMMVSDTQSSADPIYEIEYTNDVRKSMRRAYVSERIATEFLKPEPWKVDQVTSLCFLRNYRKLVFGEGAKASRSDGQRSSCGKENPWWSEDNHCKLCTEGCVFNMLCHMNLTEDANKFRQLSVHNTVQD
jgi:hypothetical protein